MVKTPPSHGGIRGSTPLRAVSIVFLKQAILSHLAFTEIARFLRAILFCISGNLKGDKLTKSKEYEKRLEELITPVLSEFGFELCDTEFVKEGNDHFLRAFIEKEGGITLNDCVDVSRKMNDILDRENFIDVPYTFEVSSPGLTRPFKKDRDFERNIGKDVDLSTYEAIDGAKEFTGVLESFDKDTITLSYPDTGEKQTFQRKAVSSIHPAIDL